MKIEYIRSMQFGYMRIALSEPLSKTEEEMLANNTIEGILPVCWQQENDRYLLRYDITGKQALDALLENTLVDEKLLKSMLAGIWMAMKQLEKYLLSQEGILLSPETIFWDYKTETIHFCYYPETEESLQERFIRLMEYMLAKTDHKNALAVRLVYGVYEEVQKPSFCIDDIQACLYEQIGMEKESVSEGDYVEVVEANKRDRRCRKIDIMEQIMAWIKDKVKKLRREEKAEEVIVFDSVEETSEQGPKTTMLGMSQPEIEGLLKYEGVNLLPDIVVVKVPFIIGSASNCDGVIKYPTISRYHAKITCRDDVYFIEDLNSTNGTKVNGGLLSYKTKVSIRKNESICFANEPYRFL